MRTVVVAGEGFRPYEVVVGAGLMAEAGTRLKPFLKAPRTAVVADETTARLFGGAFEHGLAKAGVDCCTIVIPPGEASKSFVQLERVCDELLALDFDRGDVITALGGGVVGDLAGFAAAILKRGVDFIQIPTTLLAQVDSSVGGKTAIDTSRGKNLIGAFWQPRLVLCDLDALDPLPDRELRAGYAEVLKYGLLGDRAFFERLEADGAKVLARDREALAFAVARSVEMKAEIVSEDVREQGRRALLNLGHTFAHALEAETGFAEALLHGEAVAVGCALAFRFSAAQGLCAPEDAERVERALRDAGLPSRLSDVRGGPFSAERLTAHMRQDKKSRGGELVLVLARGIGEAFVARGVEPSTIVNHLLKEGALP
jgi:3-dehydroquinate synthase